MVQTLLDTCRLESDQLPINRQRMDLRLVAEKAVQIMESHARPANQRLILSGESAIGHIDPELIERVLTNLIGNAIKASSEKDVIEIRTADSSAAAIVEVRDSGPGIPKEYQQRIFEKFASMESGDRRHLSSTGLGLTFCKMAIEAHGGSIAVQSEDGRGSTFRFEIPKIPLQASETP
jgi:signal transduction histidine kinase